ncbi:TetR/AcrR family transcriptional regulator [Rugosimonospora africana]|uniref:TetR family transcriptional regulator n=1 Tax=Rugosimonospora africana TaxID=556532 RepID=A0A8J3VSP1_9ACTN|nr:TetR family transcriptional regulator [Rugosimonospora africana]GIH17532.1 TetR family transcriptional regulator [Rugosimonospora africana]
MTTVSAVGADSAGGDSGGESGVAFDGRRARGAARRGQIVEATLRLIETGGVAAVRHRAVATAAGVPLAATTYYFATLDDLLVAALTEAAGRSAATIRAWAGSLVPGADMAVALCELVARLAGPERRATIAEYELCMAAMRRPALLPLAEGWVELLVDVVRPHMADDLSARVLVAAFDGLLIEALLAVEPPTAERMLPVATRLLAHGEKNARRTRQRREAARQG